MVTKEQALTANEFEHVTLKNADGKTPQRCRRIGKTKTWKRRPNEWSISVKRGMYEFGEINHRNAHEWNAV